MLWVLKFDKILLDKKHTIRLLCRALCDSLFFEETHLKRQPSIPVIVSCIFSHELPMTKLHFEVTNSHDFKLSHFNVKPSRQKHAKRHPVLLTTKLIRRGQRTLIIIAKRPQKRTDPVYAAQLLKFSFLHMQRHANCFKRRFHFTCGAKKSGFFCIMANSGAVVK